MASATGASKKKKGGDGIVAGKKANIIPPEEDDDDNESVLLNGSEGGDEDEAPASKKSRLIKDDHGILRFISSTGSGSKAAAVQATEAMEKTVGKNGGACLENAL